MRLYQVEVNLRRAANHTVEERHTVRSTDFPVKDGGPAVASTPGWQWQWH